jgi:hypothetical protein
MKDPIQYLTENGWREYPDQFRKARTFYKRFDTPTKCNCNNDKDGMQVCIAVSEFQGRTSLELDLCGELPDESWVKLLNYGFREPNIETVVASIPRLLATWETFCNFKP